MRFPGNRFISIKTRLFLIIVLFLLLPVLVLGVAWSIGSSRTIERTAIEYNQVLASQANYNLDYYFRDLERATLPLLIHPAIRSFMTIDPNDEYAHFANYEQLRNDVSPAFTSGRTDIYSFALLSLQGNFFSNETTIGAEEMFRLYGPMMEEQLDRGAFRIIGVNLAELTPVMTLIRASSFPVYTEARGLVIVNVRLNQIMDFAQKVKLGRTGFLSIIDASGNYAYHPDRDKWGKPVETAVWRDIAADRDLGYIVSGKGSAKRIMIHHRSALTGWVVVSEVPYAEMVSGLNPLRVMSIWMMGCMAALVLVLLGGYALYLTRSLLRLQRLMKRAEQGDLSVVAAAGDNSEIGRLNGSFNTMVGEMRRLIQEVHVIELREKETEIKRQESMLKALQSQVNPHFFYNALEIINSCAIVGEGHTISRITSSLSQLFRYTSNHRHHLVTLRDEIGHVRSYLDIQRMRYDCLQSECRVDDDLLDAVPCIRLTLQPIVENAFVHGYERAERMPSYLALTGHVRENAYVIRIADRGGGMPQEKVERYNRAFRECPPDARDEEGRDGAFAGIGMWNVHKRLRMTYGEGYGLDIVKSDGAGTVIEIALPYARRSGADGLPQTEEDGR
ncbi:MAG: sensor histidine kinase [Paenibacillaceae bacterium]|nr:sensor histidine kinase [Paenibacillaceae bacterium]